MAGGSPSTSSGLKSSSGVITSLPAKLRSVIFKGDGTNASSALVYNAQAATAGQEVASVGVKAGDVRDNFDSSEGVYCGQGIYLNLTGTGAAAIVEYELI